MKSAFIIAIENFWKEEEEKRDARAKALFELGFAFAEVMGCEVSINELLRLMEQEPKN